MKTTIILMLSFITLTINVTYAQKKVYTGGQLEYSNRDKGIKKNIGKNVTLTVDDFFKSYTVEYTDINGYKNKMTFAHDGSKYEQYIYNGIIFVLLMPADLTLGKDKNSPGFISFSDVRMSSYGGTSITYNITKLKLK